MRGRIAAGIAAALAMVFVVGQWRAISTENINWDEFALLYRAEASMRTGQLDAGGRPGLATLMLLPFVDDCVNAVQAVVGARKLWLAFTLAYLAGVAALVLAAAGRRSAVQGAALAVGLLAFVPAFLRWSLQVRTDQPALMFACWGGVCLLLAPRRRLLAVAAGVLFGLGYLASQKVVYVAALTLVLLPLRLARHEWRRAVEVLAMTGLAAVAAIAGYIAIVGLWLAPPIPLSIEGTFNVFAFYRSVFGYRAYEAMLPTLIPHLLIVGVTTAAALLAVRRPIRCRAQLIAAGALLLVGTAVARFHAGAFPYFWMTLGLFPAVAAGVALDGIGELFGRTAARGLAIAASVILLIVAIPLLLPPRDDTQRVQRDALAFIERNFEPAARGFHAEGALICRHDPNPFPIYFADRVAAVLGGTRGRLLAEAFVDEFRTRPVAFLIAHRLFPFPDLIEGFWRSHYVMYRDEVMIPGRHVTGQPGQTIELEVIVPGEYRWLTTARGPTRLRLGERQLANGGVVTLARGPHTFTLVDEVRAGMLVLAVKDDPRPPGPNFYDPVAIHELDPLYPRFSNFIR